MQGLFNVTCHLFMRRAVMPCRETRNAAAVQPRPAVTEHES